MAWGWLLSQPPWRLGARRRSQVVPLFKGSLWKGAEGGQELGVLANGLGLALVPAPLETRSQERLWNYSLFLGFTLGRRKGGQELGDVPQSSPLNFGGERRRPRTKSLVPQERAGSRPSHLLLH